MFVAIKHMTRYGLIAQRRHSVGRLLLAVLIGEKAQRKYYLYNVLSGGGCYEKFESDEKR